MIIKNQEKRHVPLWSWQDRPEVEMFLNRTKVFFLTSMTSNSKMTITLFPWDLMQDMHTYINTCICIHRQTDKNKANLLQRHGEKIKGMKRLEYIISNFKFYDKIIAIQSATELRLCAKNSEMVNLKKNLI